MGELYSVSISSVEITNNRPSTIIQQPADISQYNVVPVNSAIFNVNFEYFYLFFFVLIILTNPNRPLRPKHLKFEFFQLFTLSLKFANFIPKFDLNPPTAVWVCRLKREFRMPNNLEKYCFLFLLFCLTM